jgi:2-polyprenyl-6-methoxyphenol hydroxylase-like FAD-dependent oxidoreductase
MDAPEGAYQKHLTATDTEKIRSKFLSSSDFFANWAPELKSYLANAEGPFRAWPLYRLPVSSLSWDRVPGVTLLGDAAHLSTPLVGEGVNMAMFDALMLSKLIMKCTNNASVGGCEKTQLENALEKYEKEMLERGRDHISRCMGREKEFFSENAAEDFIEMVNTAIGQGKGEIRADS